MAMPMSIGKPRPVIACEMVSSTAFIAIFMVARREPVCIEPELSIAKYTARGVLVATAIVAFSGYQALGIRVTVNQAGGMKGWLAAQ